MRLLLFILITLTFAACAPLPYQSAQQASGGFLEEEVSPGVFLVEVKHANSWWRFNNRGQQIVELKRQWTQRANELCQHGFQGDADIISPAEARIEVFQCKGEHCYKQLMASGIAWCHKRYHL